MLMIQVQRFPVTDITMKTNIIHSKCFLKKKIDLMFRIPFPELDNAAYICVACTCLTHTKTWLTFMFVLICTFRAG